MTATKTSNAPAAVAEKAAGHYAIRSHRGYYLIISTRYSTPAGMATVMTSCSTRNEAETQIARWIA